MPSHLLGLKARCNAKFRGFGQLELVDQLALRELVLVMEDRFELLERIVDGNMRLVLQSV